MKRLFLAAALGLLAACNAGSTEVPATEVILVVDATSDVRTRSDSLAVSISGSTDRDGPFADPITLTYGPPSSRIAFPRHIALVPQMGDAKRFFEVTATASGGGAMVASTLVRSGYLPHQTLQLRIVLDDSCRPVSCPIGQTCRHGVCQDVFIDPGMLPAVDGGTPTDGGTTDLGNDALIDAAPVDAGPPDAGGGDAGCASDAVCDDHDPCNGVEHCIEGACVADTSHPTCDDSVACTTDSCVAGTGCTHVPVDALCTVTAGGRCDATGGCQYMGACTTATCAPDPASCITASCSGATCNRASTCSAGQTCCAGTCVAPGCDDGNPCTDDACGAGGCTHTANTAPCSDGDLCTSPDVCSGSACHAGAAMSCDDFNPCTADACSSGACTHMADNRAACSDGDACTDSDYCLAGVCHGTILVGACDDGNLCTNDGCDSLTGMCTHTAVALGTPCNDPDSCFTGGHCAGSTCAGGMGCSAPTPYCCPGSGCSTSGTTCP